jgi:membrane protease YdiL (CAAX protease family)
MQNHRLRALLRLVFALLIGLVISIVTLRVPGVLGVTKASPPWLSAFVTHTLMWIVSVSAIVLLTRGKMAEYGLSRGEFRLTGKIFLWVIPTAILSVLGFIASRSGAPVKPGLGLSPIQSIIFVWIYASVSEEIFTRGLLQSFLSPLAHYGLNLSKNLRLSLPVLFSGLYFGLMHVVAINKMGPPVIVLTTLLGLVAGYYREKTESLMPAIIIHALFNIGGMLPMWILSWLF